MCDLTPGSAQASLPCHASPELTYEPQVSFAAELEAFVSVLASALVYMGADSSSSHDSLFQHPLLNFARDF